jgi:hypothetical protein
MERRNRRKYPYVTQYRKRIFIACFTQLPLKQMNYFGQYMTYLNTNAELYAHFFMRTATKPFVKGEGEICTHLVQ